MTRTLVFLFALLLAATPSANEELVSFVRAELLSKVQASYPNADIDIHMQALDPRLKLASCDSLTAEPRGATLHGRVHVVVTCAAPKPWRVYLTAVVDVMVEVVTTRRAVERGVRLVPADVQLTRSNLGEVHGQVLHEFDQSIGYATKRNLSAGTVLTLPMLKTLPMVRKGETIALASRVGQAQISTRAIALESGRLGEQIRVRNRTSDRVVNAWITGPGRTSTRRIETRRPQTGSQLAKSS